MQKELYKNYFMAKATEASSISNVYNSLKALEDYKNHVYLKQTGKGYILADASISSLEYQVLDTFSKEAKINTVNKALLINLSNEEKTDITSKVKADGNTIKVEFGTDVVNMKWTSFIIAFEITGPNNQICTVNKFFQVKTEIF